MRRRQFLASGTALFSVAVPGCAHPDVVLDMDEATADDIADQASMLATPDSEEYTVVTSAVENGSATRRGRYALFGREDTVRVDDAFYEVSETRLAGSEVTVYEVLVDVDPEDSTPEVGEIAFEDLPETDRQRLEDALADHPPEGEGYDAGVDYGSAEEVGTDSVFVLDRQFDVLVYEGEWYRIAVDTRTALEAEYRYEVTEVAGDVASYADRLRAEYRFTLSELSQAEREVVREAIEGAYYKDDEAFRSVVERIRAHEGLSMDDFYGTWLLEYEDSEYLTYAEW